MTVRPRPSLARRLVTGLVSLVVLAVVVVVNRPMVAAASEAYHELRVNLPSYKRDNGHWTRLRVPPRFRVNGIHAALLRTGKVLIVAGSGNNRDAFRAGTFRTVLFDPVAETFTEVPTPTDVFCAGHTFLASGNLLVAGGTKTYEVLAKNVTHAAGVMTLKNESPAGGTRVFPKGTRLKSAAGRSYRLRTDVTLPPATAMTHGTEVMVHASQAEAWVDAEAAGDAPIVRTPALYRVEGLTGDDRRNVYGVADKITREKQEYGGDRTSYEFDPVAERYVRTGDLVRNRWYPTLTETPDGNVLAVSGLDGFGRIIPGDNERYLVGKKKWEPAPELKRQFPTYPAFHTMDDGRLFYSGANSGYGSDKVGRTPGIWDLTTNAFTTVPGLRDAGMTETSSSVLLPPAQEQKVMLFGGGAVGESPVSTARTAIVDLNAGRPAYRPGPDLPHPARYLSTVVLPDDGVLTTGGSSGYRGGPYRGATRSDLFSSQIYRPDANRFETAAESTVGRNYHSEAILLPDGRVVTLGSDPLYAPNGRDAGTFEQRIEIYSPPYLFRGRRPVIVDGPRTMARGGDATFTTRHNRTIVAARLIRPSAVTHVLDVDQRSIALDVNRGAHGLTVSVPKRRGLVPAGWYMLFLLDGRGVPSKARWVQVR